MELGLFSILAIAALILAIISLAGKIPVTVPVILLAIIEVLHAFGAG